MAGHTPGPLRPADLDGWAIRGDGSYSELWLVQDGRDLPVCAIIGRYRPGHPNAADDSAEMDRWGALFKASPDLLAACKKVMEWVDNWDPNFTQDDEWPEDRDAIRAAIARAEGGGGSRECRCGGLQRHICGLPGEGLGPRGGDA